MFQKPFKAKQTSALKNSEKKKLKSRLDKITENIPINFDKNSKISLQKIFTSTNVPFELYSENDEPMLLESKSGSLIPSIPLILKCPGFIKSENVFLIHHHVFERLQKGADLMAPGLLLSQANLAEISNLNKNDIIGIRSVTDSGLVNPILAIGQVVMTQNDIQESNLKSGKFAEVIAILGDELWNSGSLKKLPSDADAESHLETHPIKNTTESEQEQSLPDIETLEISEVEQNDEILLNAVLSSLKTTFRSADAPEFPILNSTFYSKYIRPIIKLETFDLKNTSFKKLPVFFNHLVELEMLAVKTDDKNHTYVTSVDTKHRLVRAFGNETEEEPSSQNLFENFGQREKVTLETSNKSTPVVSSLFAATAHCAKVLKTNKGTLLNAKEVRELFTEYLKDNDLLLSGGECQPDPALSQITNIKDPVTTIKKLQEAFFNKMTVNYKLEYCGQFRICKSIKGKTHPVIQISSKRCGGNRMITFVNGLEWFFIDSDDFAKAVKKKLQASVSINEMSAEDFSSAFGSRVSGKGEVFKSLQIQGDQSKILKKFLNDSFSITDKFVEVQTQNKKK